MEIFKKRRSFKAEFKRQTRLAVTAAVGFSIAYAWRDALLNMFQNFVARLLDVSPGHYLTQVYASIAITLAGVLVIFISSKLLRE